MPRLIRQLQYLLGHRRFDADLVEELESHRAMRQQELERSGVPVEQAAYESRRALGNVVLAREDARTVWIWPWLGSVGQDLVYALRSLGRQPGFALVAGGTLAAAIGLNTSLFTVYSAMAWRPWPVPETERVVNVVNGAGGNFSHVAFRHLAEHTTSFEGLFAERRAGNNTLGAERIPVSWVSGSYFGVLRVPMHVGRPFTTDDDADVARGGGALVAVLSHAFWKSRFNSDAGVVGRSITIDDLKLTVVGVASSGFMGTTPRRVDLWLPLPAATVFRPNERWVREELSSRVQTKPRVAGYLAVSGRVARGRTVAQAQAELELLATQFEPATKPGGHRVRLFGTAGGEGGFDTAPFVRMFAAVMTVLLLACANVGNLLLARAVARRREIAVRLSMGAGRARLVRQLLTESVALALVAGAAGMFLALHLPRLALEWASGHASALQLTPDASVLAFTLGLCALACLVFGLAPALHATRTDVAMALRDDRLLPGSTISLRSLLLAAQIALSVILLVSAGLLIRAVQRAHALDHGFRIEGITVMSFEPPVSSYDAARTRAFALELTKRVETLASEATVAMAHVVPFGSGNIKGTHRLPDSDEDQFNSVYEVTPSYFRVLEIPIVAGRIFGPDDNGAILVNETLARRFGSAQAAVGRTISAAPDPGWNRPGVLQIVGVARDAKRTALEEIQPTIYQPLSGRTIPQVMLRDAPGAADRITAAATELDPRIEVRATALGEYIARRLDGSRTAATIATSLGALALALAAVGMFGVVAFWVQQRTKEIGIRMALGARESQVVHLVLGSSARAIAAGLGIGFAGAIVAGTFLRSWLFGVSALDPIAYAGVGLVLVVASLAATFFPARRAARVDPLTALRWE